MNQILQVNSNKNKDNSKHKKDVMLFIIILLIVFSICMGIYMIFMNIINGNIDIPIFKDVPEDKVEIILTKVDRNKITINIQSEIGISKILYDLNGEQSKVIDGLGKTFIEETIEIPVGENIIYVSVTDINEKETTKEETIIIEAPKPVIELSVVGNNIKVIVNSEVELSEIRYKWNKENKKKENMITYENKMSFEKKLEIPIGENTLTIVAIDINGERSEKTQVIKGVTKATATTNVEGEYLHFTVVGKENIEKVEFEFNGQKFLMNTETFGETKKVHYKVKLIEGMNYLTIKSTTKSGGTETTSFEQKYTK